MSHIADELAEEFPDQVEKIQHLRLTDNHFARLADVYHKVSRAVHRAETDVDPTSDDQMADLHKTRLWLKDQIAAALS